MVLPARDNPFNNPSSGSFSLSTFLSPFQKGSRIAPPLRDSASGWSPATSINWPGRAGDLPKGWPVYKPGCMSLGIVRPLFDASLPRE